MATVLSAQNIQKHYGIQSVLQDVSIAVEEARVYGLLGPNGAGKTTLIRIINQIIAPDAGDVFFKGKKLMPDDVESIGYMPEERGLYRKMGVEEQVLYLAQLKGLSKHDARAKAKQWFDKLEVQSWRHKKIEELSKGMQQKIQFIVTVLHEPELLIFDEPFSGFDPINADILKQEILDLKKKGTTIIFSTHNMSSVEELCDDMALINRSRKITEGSVHAIKQEYKTGTYRVSFIGDAEKIAPIFTIISREETNKMVTMTIQTSMSTNEILKQLLGMVEIPSFAEVLPSINDIFISMVKADSHNNQSA